MNRTDYKIYALIGIAFACIYALFPTKMHLSDGVGYAYMLEHFSDGHFMHPHHPLWLPLMQYLYDGAKLIIPDLRSMPFICFINALLGGLSVFVFIQIAHKLSRSRMISILTGLFFGFSWGMMNYSSDSNIYILALFIILLAARIILANDKPTPNDAIKASFLMVLASVIHQITFFFTFVVLVAILLKLPKRERFRYAAICTFFYSICVFANRTLSALRLERDSLATMEYIEDLQLAYIFMTKEMIERSGASIEESEGIIEHIGLFGYNIKNIIFFKEVEPCEIKVSVRTKGDWDASKLCSLFDGGGHPRAGGYQMQEPLEKAIEKSLETIREAVKDGSLLGDYS